MKFSKSTDLALHGLWQLASKEQKHLLVSEMAGAQKVSETYLAKVFQKLVRRGLVRSTRGKKGGFSLARIPEKIRVADVVRAIEANEPLYDCLGPSRGCKGRDNCGLRGLFFEVEQKLYSLLEKTTLADLMRASPKEARRSWIEPDRV